MGYGPPKQFDPEKALQTAMMLLWKKGYAATSVGEIQQAMGIGRKSLYDTFGSKRDLYIKALQYYVDSVLAQLKDSLSYGTSPLKSIRFVFKYLVQESCQPKYQGCFISVTMALDTSADEDIRKVVQHYLRRVEELFYLALDRARQIGEISDSKDIRDLARVLTNTMQSVTMIGRIAENSLLVESAVNASLKLLED